ncbi:MAG TPA: acetylxylan esterase [Candidatus Wallbacteria bacterium]|mgnify:CR=1 FL=1|nr:acetylxylan esterase [Candidatus Wallbacteria bacterium]
MVFNNLKRALHFTLILIIFFTIFGNVYAGGGNVLTKLDKLKLEIENAGDQVKIFAAFKGTNNFEGNIDIDFYYKLIYENNPFPVNDSFCFTFQKKESRSANFITLRPSSLACVIEGKFNRSTGESSNISIIVPASRKFSAISSNNNIQSFWKKTYSEIENIELNEKFELDTNLSNANLKVYNVTYNSLDGVKIHGYYFYPVLKNKKKLPGLLHVHGYKTVIKKPLESITNAANIAVLQIELRGNGRSRETYVPETEYILDKIGSPQTYIFKGYIADCICGLRLLQKLENVDDSRLFMLGGSQGAGLVLLTASIIEDGLKAAVKTVIADEPFMCNFKLGMETADEGPYEILRSFIVKNPNLQKQIYATLSYFDLINNADRISCPVYISIGGKDKVCPPATIDSVIKIISRKLVCLKHYPNAVHEIGEAQLREKIDWLNIFLK